MITMPLISIVDHDIVNTACLTPVSSNREVTLVASAKVCWIGASDIHIIVSNTQSEQHRADMRPLCTVLSEIFAGNIYK